MKIIISSSNNSGFTLIEMMVAMVVVMFGMIGLLATIDIAMQQTNKNQLREIAVGVGEEQLRTMLAAPLASLATFSNTTTPSRPYRNGNVKFTVTRATTYYPVTPQGNQSAQLTVTVEWKTRGQNNQHQITTLRTN